MAVARRLTHRVKMRAVLLATAAAASASGLLAAVQRLADRAAEGQEGQGRGWMEKYHPSPARVVSLPPPFITRTLTRTLTLRRSVRERVLLER